jgi:hypothetical protein
MPQPQSTEEDKSGGSDQKVTPEAFEKLSNQITQLNQGIASERSARKAAEDNVAKLSKDLKEFKDKVEFSSEEEKVELSKEDETRLQAWARQQGFVTADQLQAERLKIQTQNLASIQTEATTEFLSSHPDLDDDAKWKEVQAAFNEYKTPMTKAATLKLLNKIAKEMGSEGTKSKGSDTDDLARAKARLINNGRLSLGGGQQSGGQDGTVTVEDLQRKYPNLSRDQIESRVAEINNLYEKPKTGDKKK